MRPLRFAAFAFLVAVFSATAEDAAIPPNQDTAAAALKASTRHQEFVRLKLPSGGEVNTFVVFQIGRAHV